MYPRCMRALGAFGLFNKTLSKLDAGVMSPLSIITLSFKLFKLFGSRLPLTIDALPSSEYIKLELFLKFLLSLLGCAIFFFQFGFSQVVVQTAFTPMASLRFGQRCQILGY